MNEADVQTSNGADANPCSLSSLAAAEVLLEQYDRESREWAYEKRERFWAAVDLAHQRGRYGQGRRIALIDGSFDTTMAVLSERAVLHARTDEPGGLAHGTVVALLVSEVAPQAELLLYEVCDPKGIPQYGAICASVAQAIEDGADVISLSLGRYEPTASDPARHGGRSPGFYRGKSEDRGKSEALRKSEDPGESECELCRVADLAAESGVTVVAAAGNRAELVMCPARSSSVVGCGFHTGVQTATAASDGGYSVQVSATVPGQQSQVIDFTLEQPADVLGTSFATPLLAGFAALFEDRSELAGFLSAELAASAASVMQNLLDNELIDRSHLPEVAQMYANALAQLPHRHEPSTPPCPECSMLGETTYANYGRFLFFSQDFGAAETLLRIGRAAAPRSPHVAANLGALLLERRRRSTDPNEQRALVEESASLYATALKHSSDGPAKEMYLAYVERLNAALSQEESP